MPTKKNDVFKYSVDLPKGVFEIALEKVQAANSSLISSGYLPPGIDQSRVVVEPPKDPAHGDIATNDAMVLAKAARKPPREIAEAVAAKLREDTDIEKADVAGPGFINLSFKQFVWTEALRAAIKAGTDYGRGVAHGGPVNVEYVSANPTGPMHVGHCRGAVFGDALANLLAFRGRDVTREYYVNDAGAQVDVLARSAYLRYREALGEDIGDIPEGLYPGDYLKPVGEALAAEHGNGLKQQPEEQWLPLVRRKAVDMMMAMIRDDLAALNIQHDEFTSEFDLVQKDEVRTTIEELKQAGYVKEGRLDPPKGVPIEDWEDREQLLFLSKRFGDDVNRPLVKSDGTYTYFASDIAYHKDKMDRGFQTMIDVWGADHAGYIKRMEAAVDALNEVRSAKAGANTTPAELRVNVLGAQHIPKENKRAVRVDVVQLVRLLRAGEPVKMSKRSGDFVTLREVVDEVGKDAVRFMMLYRKNDAVLDFDLAKVIEQSRDNPVFYVQYGHARAFSIFRNARQTVPDLPEDAAARAKFLADAPLERLDDAAELALMKKIAEYPRLIEAAAAAHEPHRIAFYLYELASEFHAHWTRGGKESPHLRFIIQSDPRLTVARLALVQGVATVLASGLALLGVGAPEEMR
jgi:arginyl-tRNA synthetase